MSLSTFFFQNYFGYSSSFVFLIWYCPTAFGCSWFIIFFFFSLCFSLENVNWPILSSMILFSSASSLLINPSKEFFPIAVISIWPLYSFHLYVELVHLFKHVVHFPTMFFNILITVILRFRFDLSNICVISGSGSIDCLFFWQFLLLFCVYIL